VPPELNKQYSHQSTQDINRNQIYFFAPTVKPRQAGVMLSVQRLGYTLEGLRFESREVQKFLSHLKRAESCGANPASY
jgi:hypothetical protein